MEKSFSKNFSKIKKGYTSMNKVLVFIAKFINCFIGYFKIYPELLKVEKQMTGTTKNFLWEKRRFGRIKFAIWNAYGTKFK